MVGASGFVTPRRGFLRVFTSASGFVISSSLNLCEVKEHHLYPISLVQLDGLKPLIKLVSAKESWVSSIRAFRV